MPTIKPNAGDIVYLPDGRRAEFLVDSSHGAIVRLGFYSPTEDGDDEYFAGVEIADRVFTAPPMEAVDKRVTEMLAQETAARARLDGIRAEIRAAERDSKERMAKFAMHPPLDMLEALLDGRITHFATKPDHADLANIETFEDATTWIDNEYGRNRKELRMLALVTSRPHEMEWKINTYGDGSGGWKSTVWPCLSYEDALAKVTELCLAAAAKLTRNNVDSRHFLVSENAQKYGIAIPGWITDAVVKSREDARRAEIERAEAALANARAKATS